MSPFTVLTPVGASARYVAACKARTEEQVRLRDAETREAREAKRAARNARAEEQVRLRDAEKRRAQEEKRASAQKGAALTCDRLVKHNRASADLIRYSNSRGMSRTRMKRIWGYQLVDAVLNGETP